jgi:hypothetical protein
LIRAPSSNTRKRNYFLLAERAGQVTGDGFGVRLGAGSDADGTWVEVLDTWS